MPVTLQPVFEALGYTDAKQQRALVKLLQAAHAFGDVQGVSGMLTDQQADAILQHVTFDDAVQAASLLRQITQDSLLRPKGRERHECEDCDEFRQYRAELIQALQDSGMIAEMKPARRHYDHVLLLGAIEGEMNGRFDTLKKLWDDGVRFDKVHLLGSRRPLVPGVEPSLNAIGPDGRRVTDEMDMMEAHYYDKASRWPDGLEKVRVFEVNTFDKDNGERVNTQDTIKSWMKTRPDAGDVLVISSQPFARYQEAAVKSVLPPSFHVDTASAPAADDVRISVALDSFARQIDVNFSQLVARLRSGATVLSTPIIGVDPDEVKVDAPTYQFRRGGDADGVTPKWRLQAQHWDPVLHGDPILIHERLDGSKYVADGHHRLALAKELNAKGTGPGNILAMVLSEKQGYTAKDARIVAAYKNIAQGHTDAVETARIFKEASAGDVHRELLPNLQMDKSNLKMAFTMSRLSDKVLDRVEAEKIEPKIAAKLAELVPDDHQRQEAIMQVISRKLHQRYETPEASRPTSVHVHMPDAGAPEVPGFVAKLAMQKAMAQTSTLTITTR